MLLREIIRESQRVNNIDDVINNLDCISEVLKEDVMKIAKSKRIYFPDFDFFYRLSINTLKNQLSKKHLKAIKRFYECENLEIAIKFIIERLLNNMKNLSTNRRYKDFIEIKLVNYEIDIADEANCIDTLMVYEDLKRISKDEIVSGLKRLWTQSRYDADFELQDIQDLCKKFNIKEADVIKEEELNQPKLVGEQVANGHSQLTLIF